MQGLSFVMLADHEAEIGLTLERLRLSNVENARLWELMARAYMRLQCADVPRDPWHWEVGTILNSAPPFSTVKSSEYSMAVPAASADDIAEAMHVPNSGTPHA